MNHVVLALTEQQAGLVAAALGKLPLEIAYDTFESIKKQRAQQAADMLESIRQRAASPPAPPPPPPDAPVYHGAAQAAAD